MRLSIAVVAINAAALASIGTLAFRPSRLSQLPRVSKSQAPQTEEVLPAFSSKSNVSPSSAHKRPSYLSMGYKYDPKNSNIFDGPLALTKERDACGVGFIANPIQRGCKTNHCLEKGGRDMRSLEPSLRYYV